MDNKATTKRMIGAVVLVLVAALLLAWLLKGKNRESQEMAVNQTAETKPIIGFPGVEEQKPGLVNENPNTVSQLGQNTVQGTNDLGQQNLNLEGSVNAQVVNPNGTDLSVRPNTTAGTGSVGTGDASSTTTTAAQTSGSVAATGAGVGSVGSSSSSSIDVNASAKDQPKSESKSETSETHKKSTAVLVGERPVPKAESEESAREKAAAKKEASEKAAAEKAAAEKSKELAAANKEKTTAETNKPDAGASTGSAVTGYAIQLMASADKAKAEAVAKPLVAEGYKVAVAEVKVDGKTIYRVRIGGYPTKEEAVAAQAKLKARYTQNPDVQNSFVTQ